MDMTAFKKIRYFYLLLLSLLFLTACSFSRPLLFTPNVIEPLIVGSDANISLRVMKNDTPVGGVKITKGTLPSGLVLHYKDPNDLIEILGKPMKVGVYPITLDVWCYGTNYPGQVGKKSYVIKVIDNNGTH